MTSLHVAARVVGFLVAPGLHQRLELLVGALRQHYAHGGEQIAGAVFGFDPLALEAEGAAGTGAGGNRQIDRAIERRHPDFAAEHGFVQRHRQIEPQIGAVRLEQRMRRDINHDQRVAGFAGGARPALPFQADGLAAGDAGRDLDLDVLAGRQMHARLAAARGFRQRDGERGLQVLAGRRLSEFLRLELGAEAAAARAARCAAEHAAQQILEAAAAKTAAAAGALEAVGAETEALELRALPGVETALLSALEAVKARLALGVDFAAVEGFALVVVADDLVGGVELGKARGRLGVVLVGVGMQLFGELAIGAFDLRLARTLGYPQDLVGVAHQMKLRERPQNAGKSRRLMRSMWGSRTADATRLGLRRRRAGAPTVCAHSRASGNPGAKCTAENGALGPRLRGDERTKFRSSSRA